MYKKPNIGVFRAFFIISPKPSRFILGGWLCILFAIILSLIFPDLQKFTNRSGALLLAATIAGGLYFNGDTWRKLIDIQGKNEIFIDKAGYYVFVTTTGHHEPIKDPKSVSVLDALMSFDHSTVDIISLPLDQGLTNLYNYRWRYYDDFSFASNRLELIFAISAFTGTILWGFGDLLFK